MGWPLVIEYIYSNIYFYSYQFGFWMETSKSGLGSIVTLGEIGRESGCIGEERLKAAPSRIFSTTVKPILGKETSQS